MDEQSTRSVRLLGRHERGEIPPDAERCPDPRRIDPPARPDDDEPDRRDEIARDR